MLHVNCNIFFVQEQLRFCSKANVRRVCLPSFSDRRCEKIIHSAFISLASAGFHRLVTRD